MNPGLPNACTRLRRLAGSVGVMLVPIFGCSPLYGPTGQVAPPASADPASVAAEAVGCWELSWSITEESGSDRERAGLGPLPDSVSFEDSALFGSGRRLVTPATEPLGRGFEETGPSSHTPWEQVYRSNRWWTEEGRVTVLFSDGDGRLWSLSLEPADDTLDGTGVYRVRSGPDVGSVEAEVRARRIACPPS